MRPQISRSVLFRVIRRVVGKVKFRPARSANRIPVMRLKPKPIAERLRPLPVPPGHWNGDRFFCHDHGGFHDDDHEWSCEDGVWMITKQTCLEQGGHCWTDNGTGVSTGYQTSFVEYCKHCPAQRARISRDPWYYEELPDRG